MPSPEAIARKKRRSEKQSFYKKRWRSRLTSEEYAAIKHRNKLWRENLSDERKEQIRQRSKEYFVKNRQRYYENAQRFRCANREKLRKRAREYYAKMKTICSEYNLIKMYLINRPGQCPLCNTMDTQQPCKKCWSAYLQLREKARELKSLIRKGRTVA